MGDPLGGNILTTNLMIENRQSSEKFVADLARLFALGSREADRRARTVRSLCVFVKDHEQHVIPEYTILR